MIKMVSNIVILSMEYWEKGSWEFHNHSQSQSLTKTMSPTRFNKSFFKLDFYTQYLRT